MTLGCFIFNIKKIKNMIQVIVTIEDIEREIMTRMRDDRVLVWKTRSGKIIPLKDLDTRHLINIYNMLKKDEELYDHLGDGYDEWK